MPIPGSTARTERKTGPGFEHARKLNGTKREVRSPGGKTFSAAAVFGRQLDGEKFPTSVKPTSACALPRFGSVTVCTGSAWSRRAALPSWWPLQAETPGNPRSRHDRPEMFVSSSG